MFNIGRHLISWGPVDPLAQCRRVFSNQWSAPTDLHRVQNRKLKALVNMAYQNVDYYRKLFDEYGLSPNSIQSLEDLSRVPVTTKADLQTCSEDEIVHRGFRRETLASESSSGSTGRPFRVYYDPNYHWVRNMLFLRGLVAAGYRFGQKILLVTDVGKKDRRLLRWYYSSILDSPEKLLAALNRVKPQILYGCKTPMVRLAEYIRDNRVKAHTAKRIVSTAEMLDPESRSLLETVFSTEVSDFYGSTEMGLVGWQCKAGNGYHLSADSVVLELLPLPGESGLARMIMTNLDLMAMPLIRYDTGDLAIAGFMGQCPCGRRLPKILRVDGRYNDSIKMRDGRTISPYQLTCAIEKVPGVLKYQVVQTDWEDFTVKVKILAGEKEAVGKLVSETMSAVIGDGIHLHLYFDVPFEYRYGRKFSAVISRVGSNKANFGIV